MLGKKKIYTIIAAGLAISLYAAASYVDFFPTKPVILFPTLAQKAREQGFEIQTIKQHRHYYQRWAGVGTHNSIRYQFAFNPSALYIRREPYNRLSMYQAHWNKLAGFSDCGSTDLSQNGAMFAWRTHPAGYLEVAAYANYNGEHFYADYNNLIPIFRLTLDEISEFNPVTYQISIEKESYIFSAKATLHNGRVIDYHTELPRQCTAMIPLLKNFSNFYFGGRLPAPHTITGYYKDLTSQKAFSLEGLINSLRLRWQRFYSS